MINKLTDIYVKWCSDNNVPNVSADEQDRDKLTYEQKSWLDDFIENWDNQQSVDYFIYENTKKGKKGEKMYEKFEYDNKKFAYDYQEMQDEDAFLQRNFDIKIHF